MLCWCCDLGKGRLCANRSNASFFSKTTTQKEKREPEAKELCTELRITTGSTGSWPRISSQWLNKQTLDALEHAVRVLVSIDLLRIAEHLAQITHKRPVLAKPLQNSLVAVVRGLHKQQQQKCIHLAFLSHMRTYYAKDA